MQTATGRLLARSGTTIKFGDTSPRVARGDVLAVGNHLRVAMQAANVVVDGVTRITQGLTLEIAAYDGATSVRTRSDEYALDALRRVVIAGAGGATSGRVSPITLDPSDAWDRRYLGVAIELDRALTERSRGISLQTEGTGAGIKSQLMSVLSSWMDLMPLGDNAVGEAVVAAELATEAKLDSTGLREMLVWRADGAPWGLIAYQLGLTSMPDELPGVDATAVREPSVTTPSTAAIVPTPPTTPTTTATGPRFVVPGAGAVAPAPTPTTTTVPPPVVADPLGGLVNTVGNVLGGLLGQPRK